MFRILQASRSREARLGIGIGTLIAWSIAAIVIIRDFSPTG